MVDAFRRVATIAAMFVQLIKRDTGAVVILIVMPIIVMGFLKPLYKGVLRDDGHPLANGAEQAVPGQLVMFSFFLVGFVGYSFLEEHGWGTWQRVRASPARSAEILIGKAVPPVVISCLQQGVLLLAGTVLFGLKIRGSLWALSAIGIAFALCLVALGLALSGLCSSALQLSAIANVSALALAGLGGALAPTDLLPGWVSAVAPATPAYWAVRGYRDVILDHRGIQVAVEPVAVLLGFTLFFAVVAATRFRFDDRKTAWE